MFMKENQVAAVHVEIAQLLAALRRVSLWSFVVSIAAAMSCGAAAAQDLADGCGRLESTYGPFDYRTATNRATVENFHFTPKVESLRGGNTSSTPGGDLNYTLRVFPNHPRALVAVIRLAEREKTSKPREMEYTVECWLQRAERFTPDDATVKSLYGVYLLRVSRPKEGAAKLEEALALGPKSAEIHYNLGLAYFDLGRYDQSLENAHKAYAVGFALPGLRDKLIRAGKWQPLPDAAKEAGSTHTGSKPN
jgi:tetratricopeptide (TPR) repeat protein